MVRRRQMKELPPCPRCGMYGGKRMVATGNADGFFVLCDSCGSARKTIRTSPMRSAFGGKPNYDQKNLSHLPLL